MTENEKHRLVLIDDSEIVLAVMVPVLEEAGFEVRAGAELCTWLRNQVATGKTPVIICSSAPDAALAEVAQSVGADGYVSKQSGPEALPVKLHALCEEIIF